MRSAATAALALALAFAPAALAQDPAPSKPPAGGEGEKPAAPPTPAPAPAAPVAPVAPAKPAAPTKHVNVVTDAAKAAFDAMKKVIHDPVASGLKELQGNLVFRIEIEGMEEQMAGQPELRVDFAVDFKAPGTFKAEGRTENPMLEMQMDQTRNLVDSFVLYSFGIMEPKADSEYDADVVTEEGKKFLLIKNYDQNVPGKTFKLALDANGLPGKGSLKATDPMMGVEQTVDVELRFAKDGERYRFDRFVINQPGAAEPMEFVASYADVGGFKLLSGVTAGVQTQIGPAKLSFRYDSLTVNGKKVDLPKPPEPKKEEAKPAAPPAGTGAAGPGEKAPEKAPEKKPEEPKPEEKKDEPK